MATTTSVNESIANKTAEAFLAGFNTYQPLAPVLFRQHDPKRKDEIFSIHAFSASWNALGEGDVFPSNDIQEVGTITMSQLRYAEKIPITQMMKNFDSEGMLLDEATKLGYSARVQADQLHANVLVNGFGTELTWDGNSLFNDSHNVGSLTGVTQDNLVSGALTDSTLNDAIVLLRRQVDHRNQSMPLVPRVLVVPPDLEKKARELVESGLDPESANNSINTNRSRGIHVVVWELLTSTTAWFLLADKPMHGLVSLVSQPLILETRDRLLTESGNTEVRAEFHLTAGARDYLGAVGSTGA